MSLSDSARVRDILHGNMVDILRFPKHGSGSQKPTSDQVPECYAVGKDTFGGRK